MAPLRPCVHPGCGALVARDRCPAHAVQRERQRPNLVARRWYYTAQWKALREDVLNANPLCVDCQAEGRVSRATEIDHIVRHQGDPALFWRLTNLQGLCPMHHSMKTRRGE
jgi:5-methylcytosine-specific restriction protein A